MFLSPVVGEESSDDEGEEITGVYVMKKRSNFDEDQNECTIC